MALIEEPSKSVIRNETAIPKLGLGTWELRGEQCAQIVAQALALGYRHIDTAQGYANEHRVAEGLRQSGVPRRDVFITTKVMPQLLGDGALQKSVEGSLKSLGIDRLDLVLIHWPNWDIPLADSMKALEEVRATKLSRAVGVSNFTVALLDKAMRHAGELAMHQIEYHPYVDQDKILAATRKYGLAVTAYCPIAQGHVVGDPTIEAIANTHGKTAAQTVLRWLVQQPDVIAIPRTAKPERLAENAEIFDFKLTADEMARISALKRGKIHLVNEPFWVPAWD